VSRLLREGVHAYVSEVREVDGEGEINVGREIEGEATRADESRSNQRRLFGLQSDR
jgi:hypothetical protein